VVHQRVVDRHLEGVVRIQDEPKNGEKASDISYCYGTVQHWQGRVTNPQLR
jgi:hypothetical protein